MSVYQAGNCGCCGSCQAGQICVEWACFEAVTAYVVNHFTQIPVGQPCTSYAGSTSEASCCWVVPGNEFYDVIYTPGCNSSGPATIADIYVACDTTAGGTVNCCCSPGQICVYVTNYCSPYAGVPGATITVYEHGTETIVGTCVTAGSSSSSSGSASSGSSSSSSSGEPVGQCCVTVPGDASYDVTVSDLSCSTPCPTSSSGGSSLTNIFVPCGQTPLLPGVQIVCPPAASCAVFTVYGCNGLLLPGAVVTISGPVGGGGNTDASGAYTFCACETGNYSYSVSAPGYQTVTGNFTVTSLCGYEQTFGVTLAVDSEHTCCFDCTEPTPSTLYLTGPNGLNVTLTLYEAGLAGQVYSGFGQISGATLSNSGTPPNCTCTSTKTGSLNVCVNFCSFTQTVVIEFYDVTEYVCFDGSATCTLTAAGHCLWSASCLSTQDYISATNMTFGTVSCSPLQQPFTVAGLTGSWAIFNGSYLISE